MVRRFVAPTLLLSSSNAGKLAELQAMLGNYPVTLLSTASLAIAPPDETGSSFAENALLKANYYSQLTGLPALADDSGLCVEALDGAPGIYSARWAEQGFAAAIAHIKERLGAKSHRAYFACALCLWWPDGHSENVEGRIDGTLTFPPRGTQGFGYDPIFIPDGYDLTFAEISAQEKNRISHRAQALHLLKERCFTSA